MGSPALDVERSPSDRWPMDSNSKIPRAGARLRWPLLGIALFTLLVTNSLYRASGNEKLVVVPRHLVQAKARCAQLKLNPGPPPDFGSRAASDRFIPGTPATLIKNATIWTGRVDGLEIIQGDVLLDQGLVKAIGRVDVSLLAAVKDMVTVEANGAWVTPG